MGEGTGEGAGEAGAAGSFSSMVLLLLWLLSSGPEGLGLSFASSFLRTRPLGDAVVPRGDGGFGGRAWPGPGLGQGEAGLCQDVEGEDGRALDLGLSSAPVESLGRTDAGSDWRFLRLRSLRLRSRARALFSFSFSRSLSFFSFFCTGAASSRRRANAGLPPALGLRRSARSPDGVQRCALRGALQGVSGLAEAERGHTGTAAEG